MRSKDEIFKDLAHDLAATTTPESRQFMLLAVINEALIDIRDIMAQDSATEEAFNKAMQDIDLIDKPDETY